MTYTPSDAKLILIIEDTEILVNLLSKRLEREGYKVRFATDGKIGLELVHELKPALVLLDMLLPSMSGFEIIEKLHDQGLLPELPIVIISNSGQPIEIGRAQELGVRDYLIKVNFNPDEVLAKVTHVLADQKEDKSHARASEYLSHKNILIVEDDLLLVDLLEKHLKAQNYTTFQAPDVAQARAMLSEHLMDLILLDILLPNVDGFAFLTELKSNNALKDIPVIILSNLDIKNSKEKAINAGATDYLVKAHLSPSEIIDKIKKILN